MKKSNYFLIILLWICAAAPICASVSDVNENAIDFSPFNKFLEASEDVNALSAGGSIFEQMGRKYRGDAGFNALKSKLTAADFLAKQMESQLKIATGRQIVSVSDKLFDKGKNVKQDKSLMVAPAKSFYDTSAALFSKPLKIDAPGDDEKTFFGKYYDLKLRVLTSSIAKAGQALAIAEPNFKGTHDYVLVLPLLHASDKKSFDISVLPLWMRQPEQLDIFSDSCLLHFGLPFHAMMVADRASAARQEKFSELEFYKTAAMKCGTSHANTAVDCMLRAINCVPDKNPDMVINLQFEIVQLWLDSKNNALAAGQASQISDVFPNHEQAGKAIWLYYYALSRDNNAEGILANIDSALTDKRCEPYKANLMYIKWWALRRQRNETAKTEALEYELLTQYGDNPMVAPILLSRCMDLLAKQDYNGTYAQLNELLEKFPLSETAIQAKKMLDKLKAAQNVK
jgi:hypothetical protein